MKQRFSSLDVKVIAHELSNTLVPLRLSNAYDLSSKLFLLKFAKSGEKRQLLIDSGFRCHLTDFSRTTAARPSVFVEKLRKILKTRRCTAVSQVGTDRIIEFQFSDGQYRMYLEFFASGNIIVTNHELQILTLLRNVPEGEGQEPQRPGLTYSLENRQNYKGVPELTRERLQSALTATVEKAAIAAASGSGKKVKRKPGDELRKGLAVNMPEFPPILLNHAMTVTGFDPTSQPATVLENVELLDALLRSLKEAQKIIGDITSSATSKGYIFATRRQVSSAGAAEANEGSQKESGGLLYDDFHPFLPQHFEANQSYEVITFDNFNKTVDEFFSSIEGQKLESKLSEREAAALRRLEAAKQDQAKRIEGLQVTQQLNIRKAAAIEANVERIQEAMGAVNGLVAQGMTWPNIEKLVELEQRRNNPVASIIALPLNLAENTITLKLDEAEEEEDEDEANETDSDDSDDGRAATDALKQKGPDRKLAIDINLGISPWANATEYYDEKRTAAAKEEKTAKQSEIALKQASQKIATDLKRGLKGEKPLMHAIRQLMWFEKFIWFISSDGYLIIGGKDASQNEILYRRHLKKGDIYVHADLKGAASMVVKNNPRTPDAPIPPSTLSQAGIMTVSASSAWESKAVMPAYWVTAEQVSKKAPTGDFLPQGEFMIHGEKNFLAPSQLVLGFGLMFRISEESKARHLKHRLIDPSEPTPTSVHDSTASTVAASETGGTLDGDRPDEGSDTEQAESDLEDDTNNTGEKDAESRENPLQSSGAGDVDDGTASPEEAQPEDETEETQREETQPEETQPEEQMQDLKISEEHEDETGADDDKDEGTEADGAPETRSDAPSQSGKSTPQPKGQKQAAPKRGQKAKAKKIAAKYRDQDEEDRVAIETLIGATTGQKKAEAEKRAKEEREAAQAAAKERRRAQHQRQQKEVAEHEEARKLMLEEGGGDEALDADEAEKTTPLDSLVGAPLPGDEILEVVCVCAPHVALGKLKYKVKLQPGSQKKGKAVREILENWKKVSEKKGVVDDKSTDKERMWPREVELIKSLKPEDAVNIVPVKLLKVMMIGGASGGGGGGAKGKGKARGKKR